jgi:lactoylglutathione lyase
MWELIERKNLAPDSEPLCQVMLRVTDLDASIKYYTEVLGMRLLRTRVNEEHKYTLAFVGYEDEDKVRAATSCALTLVLQAPQTSGAFFAPKNEAGKTQKKKTKKARARSRLTPPPTPNPKTTNPNQTQGTVIELTYNHGRGPENPYKPGNAYAQVAISTDDVYKSAEAIKAAGGQVTREPGPVPGIGTKILATVDPDGYKYVLVDNADFLEELK